MVVGAHGIIIEVHPEPEKALSDGAQSLTFQGMEKMMEEINRLNEFLGYR
jgi:3-deoxy-7-phosphoheptulonate synthase